MGGSYSVVLPNQIVLGMGGSAFQFELMFSGWFHGVSVMGTEYVAFYDIENEYSPIARINVGKNLSNTQTLSVSMNNFKVGHKYIAKYWQNDTFWGSLLCQSKVMTAKSFEQVLEDKLTAATVAAANVQAKVATQAQAAQAQAQKAAQAQAQTKANLELKRQIAKENEEEIAAEIKSFQDANTYELSYQERRLARKYFDIIDTDGSNSIELSELRHYLSTMKVPAPSQAAILMLDEGDANHNGSLDFHEFITIIAKAASLDASKHWGTLWSEIEAELGGSSPRGNKKPKSTQPAKVTRSAKKTTRSRK